MANEDYLDEVPEAERKNVRNAFKLMERQMRTKSHMVRINACRFFYKNGVHMPYTYRQLRDFLNAISEEALNQNVMILPPEPEADKPILLEPVYEIGTVEHYCHDKEGILQETRSSDDFKHRPEQLVLLRDYCPFSEQGDSSYVLEKDGMRGNVTGKLFPLGGKD